MSQFLAGARAGRQKLYLDPFTVSAAPGFSTGVTKSAKLPGGPVLGLVRDPTDFTLYPVNTFGGVLSPRTLSFTRGTGGSGPYQGDGRTAALALSLPAATFATATKVWRGLLTHFVMGPFAVATSIPAQMAEFGYFSQHTDPYTATYVMASLYATDAAGAVTAYLYDRDTKLGGGDGVNYTGNRLVYFPLSAGVIPAGGYLAFEVFYCAELLGTSSTTSITFNCGGWNDVIPPNGQGGFTQLEKLADTCASYLAIAGLSDGLLFDAMQDAALPLKVRHQWATPIIPSRAGGEQRLMLRDAPRELLDIGFGGIDTVTTLRESSKLDALLKANDETGYRLPWWPDAQALAADCPSGSVVLPINTTGIDFTAGGEVVFYLQPGAY